MMHFITLYIQERYVVHYATIGAQLSVYELVCSGAERWCRAPILNTPSVECVDHGGELQGVSLMSRLHVNNPKQLAKQELIVK